MATPKLSTTELGDLRQARERLAALSTLNVLEQTALLGAVVRQLLELVERVLA